MSKTNAGTSHWPSSLIGQATAVPSIHSTAAWNPLSSDVPAGHAPDKRREVALTLFVEPAAGHGGAVGLAQGCAASHGSNSRVGYVHDQRKQVAPISSILATGHAGGVYTEQACAASTNSNLRGGHVRDHALGGPGTHP